MSKRSFGAVFYVLVAAGMFLGVHAFAQQAPDAADKVVSPAASVNAVDPAAGAEAVAEPEVQPAVQPTASEANEGSTVPQPRPTVMEFDVNQAGNVTLDFREADIKNVLKVLAYKSGVNIISGPEVVGLVNIQLKNVPWQKALDVILSTYGYSYEQKGVVIMVTTIENLKKRRDDAKVLAEQEPLSTETFLLNFSKAEDIVKTLDKMRTARGSINFDQRTNSVIVTDIQSNLMLFREVMKKLDAVTPQILIEARIIETGLNNQETLGIKWPSSMTATATFPVRTHTFPWSTDPTGTNANKYLPAQHWVNPADFGDLVAADPATTAMTFGTLSATSLSMTLSMLQSRANTNVLSNPRIVTLDNQLATIEVGNKYPLPKYAYSDTQDKLTISGWEYIEYGLTFKVTPHINGKGVITLDVEPQIMDESGTVPFDFGGGSPTYVPVLTKETAKTNVMIRDGETLVIAGLIKDKKTKVTTKVPVLGSIPFLGRLFSHKDDVVTKTELVIFITPHIITVTPDQEPIVVK
jgi:type IV pilus assembly protein PilQ